MSGNDFWERANVSRTSSRCAAATCSRSRRSHRTLFLPSTRHPSLRCSAHRYRPFHHRDRAYPGNAVSRSDERLQGLPRQQSRTDPRQAIGSACVHRAHRRCTLPADQHRLPGTAQRHRDPVVDGVQVRFSCRRVDRRECHAAVQRALRHRIEGYPRPRPRGSNVHPARPARRQGMEQHAAGGSAGEHDGNQRVEHGEQRKGDRAAVLRSYAVAAEVESGRLPAAVVDHAESVRRTTVSLRPERHAQLQRTQGVGAHDAHVPDARRVLDGADVPHLRPDPIEPQVLARTVSTSATTPPPSLACSMRCRRFGSRSPTPWSAGCPWVQTAPPVEEWDGWEAPGSPPVTSRDRRR